MTLAAVPRGLLRGRQGCHLPAALLDAEVPLSVSHSVGDAAHESSIKPFVSTALTKQWGWFECQRHVTVFVKENSVHGPPLFSVMYLLFSAIGRSRVPDLTKRAYLARFLKNIDIPEEFFNDETLVEMYRQFKQMQARARVENNIFRTCLLTSAQINIRSDVSDFSEIFSVGSDFFVYRFFFSNLLVFDLSKNNLLRVGDPACDPSLPLRVMWYACAL